MRRLLARLLFTGLLVLGGVVHADQVPGLIGFQGTLRDSVGGLVNGTYNLTFAIYKSSGGIDSVWKETQNSIVVTSGQLSVTLGASTVIPDSVFNNNTRYLGIKINSFTELTPRIRILAVGYALRVNTVNGATGGTIAGAINAGQGNFGPSNNNSGTDAFTAGNSNTANSTFSAVGGGVLNYAQGLASVVPGGYANHADGNYSIASGYADSAMGANCVAIGGYGNKASGNYASVAGGETNRATGATAHVGGGHNNQATGDTSVIAGGKANTSAGRFSFVGGGKSNQVDSAFGLIAGGSSNRSGGRAAVIAGGQSNTITEAINAFIGAGNGNLITSYSADDAAIVAGENDSIGSGGSGSFIGAGIGNAIRSAAYLSSIVGGSDNKIAASSYNSFIGGGDANLIDNQFAVVGGGQYDSATGQYAVVPGGTKNKASGTYSFAAGRRAKATHAGSFVWADSYDGDFASEATDQMRVRASGGVKFYTNSGLTAGVTLASGGGSWASVSDSTMKRNAREVDGTEILDKLDQLPIKQWSYKSQDPSIEHIGPMAQDFYSVFHVGDNNVTISTIDPSGIALAATKELHTLYKQLAETTESLKTRTAELETVKAQLADLQKTVQQLVQATGGNTSSKYGMVEQSAANPNR